MATMRALRHCLASLMLLTACTGCSGADDAYGPERVVEARRSEAAAPRGAGLLRRAMLDGHNRARAAVGVTPLTWSDTLAAHAQAYADQLAASGRFQHAEQPQGPAREGENLWTGTRDAYALSEMIGHWVAERDQFVNLATPAFSRTGRWEDVAHYSQIVWRGSRQVGCAIASNRSDDYLVCRYSPAGNVVGQRAF
ncbi:hypothetical protein FHS94_002080 [Sphingomonas aerophila]|uniref:SCP domain-containing protein n=2 Tax=Sphingomonas aerophila TaxID=1344948 RepID=A0A7W9EUF4_9SPHN|nr:CAP domain-containing protein [Sphingomonas aerophila]MBB5715234.1 hypothetical protein [Sphingomonas aerophila]